MKKVNPSLFFMLLVLVVGLFLGLFVPVNTAKAQATTPFGGQILLIKPCLHPFGGFHIEVGPPNGGSFIYQTGFSFSYPFGPPSHPGQWLLGLSIGGVSCYTSRSDGEWRGRRNGGLILFHGSSV